MTTLRNADMITVREDDGTLTIVPVDPDVAMALIAIYVPEADRLTFNEAWELALLRDSQAAVDLEGSIEDAPEWEDGVDVVVINRELETAHLADEA